MYKKLPPWGREKSFVLESLTSPSISLKTTKLFKKRGVWTSFIRGISLAIKLRECIDHV